jgi:CRP/FNR family transcriptional regulator, cyclic AMP receptor protein
VETSASRVQELLRSVSLFSELELAGTVALQRLVDVRAYRAGAVVVSQDERGDALYVLAEGRVKVVLYGASGREIILSIFKTPGDFFGEMSLLDEQPRSASVVALEPSTLLVLSRRDFQAHVVSHPRTALRVLREVSRRLRRADEVIGNLALLDVYGRLAGKLRELARAEGQETEDGFVVRERPTMTEIAATIGTSRETVSRLFAELSRRGLVIATGKRLLVRRAFLID